MEVKAHLRHFRAAPRKVRLVIGLVRGQSVAKAVDQLTMLPKRSAKPIMKLIQSAVANAEHNFHLDKQTLVIKSIVANEGPKLKRFQPRAFGRAAEILKRSSHVTVVLEGQPPAVVKTADKGIQPTTGTTKPKASTMHAPVATAAPKKVLLKPKSEAMTVPPFQDESKPQPSSSTTKGKARSGQDAVVRRQGTE